MEFKIENLGKIASANLILNDLTILVGDNNTGKTYITYSIYGLLNFWQDYNNILQKQDIAFIVDTIQKEGMYKINIDEIKNKLTTQFDLNSKRIKDLFNDKESVFQTAKINVLFDIKNLSFINKKVTLEIGENIFNGIIENDFLIIKLIKRSSNKQIDNFLYNNIIADILKNLLLKSLFLNPIIITAERLGISLFYKELDERRHTMIDEIQKLNENKNNTIHPLDLIINKSAYYATPIGDHINFTRNIDNITKYESKLDIDYPLSILKEILGAQFKKEYQKDIRFHTKNKKQNKFDIPLYLTSSSVRCLVDLYFYIVHLSKENDILIIDEPESHLTLKNQRLMAKLIASLINIGIKVFITTHSDFLIKELNNLILLSNNFKEKENWIKNNTYNYTEKDHLSPNRVHVYQSNISNGICTLDKLNISNKGIEIPFFDTEIDQIFKVSTELDFLTD